MGSLVDQTYRDFSESGLLSTARGYEYRPEQQEMACAVASALETEGALLVEAGTGVGKSLAYLLPAVRFALERERKAIISTHTINLQEQLFHKDIPTAARALGCDFRAALLKGRANYLCHTRLKRALEQAADLFNQEEVRQLHALSQWAAEGGEGTLAELPAELSISPKVWAQVCSESHICTLRNCGPNCPYQAARRRVEEAQVIVLNHTLFFGLLSLAELTREEDVSPDDAGFVFPGDFVILDEAHTIETVAAHQFGLSLPEAELKYDLLRLYNPRTRKGSLRHHATAKLLQYIEEAQTAADEFFTCARQDCQLEAHRGSVRLRQPEWTENILSPALTTLQREITDMARTEENDLTRAELMDVAARLLAYNDTARELIQLTRQDSSVYWAESAGAEGRFTTLRSALINVAPLLREKLFEAGRACICTSATLSAGEQGIRYFAGRVGAEGAATLRIGSPFCFAEQMRIIVARSMPPPPPASEEEPYLDALFSWIVRALESTQGRAFVLFTSYSLMRTMAVRLRPICGEKNWPLFVQGDELTRTQMLTRFKQTIGSVLLGTDSFWTGVDVPGEALSNVIVTRIPFDSPGNPLTEARLEDIRERGGNPFADYTLPEAVLKFRQGVGRLIRSRTDKGSIYLLDSRITGKFYGQRFMYALPPDAAREFL